MSKPRCPWWSTAVRMVRNYPLWKAELDQLHSQSVTADMGGMPGGSEVSRKTENIAMRQLPPAKQNEYDAVSRALEITALMPYGDKRCELIRRVYWSGKKLRITDVIMQIGIAEATSWRWHGDFIRLVGVCAGYER